MVLGLNDIMAYFVAFIRVSGIVLFLPILSSKNVPWQSKVLLAILTALLIGPFVPRPKPLNELSYLFGLFLREFALGLFIGFSTRLLFGAVEMAGQIMGFGMGFGLSEILDPTGETQLPILGTFFALFGIMMFFCVDGPYWYIKAIHQSFCLIPPEGAEFSKASRDLLSRGSLLYEIAFKVASPLLALNLLLYLGLAVMGRAFPQLNIFFVSLPLQLGVGLLGMGIMLPYLGAFLGRIFGHLGEDILRLLLLMRG